MVAGWRGLGLFWLAVFAVGGAGVAALQVLGPPAPRPHVTAAPTPVIVHQDPPGETTAVPASAPSPDPVVLAQPLGGAIASPDPALLEPAPDFPGALLPRIGPDGRMPMRVYAPIADPADKRPKVAFLLVGIGLSDSESRSAIISLPAGVTLGISPYTPELTPLLAAARAHGHEILVTLPMESQGYPLNDSGPRALLTGADPADNARNLEWVLSRVQGAAGVTGASDGLRGERFAGSGVLFGLVQQELAKRGLFYVDPRPDRTVVGAAIDVTNVVDDPPQRNAIDTRLADLEQRARDGKPAVGLAGPLRPVTVERIAAWARGLDGRGVSLVPVSALLPPISSQSVPSQ